MSLYIQTENGAVINHPALSENLVAAFGSVPDNWKPFTRVERPTLSIYQVLDSEYPEYKEVNGVWSDVWPVREMTVEEKTAKQNAVKQFWATRDQSFNWVAWVFNEETCDYGPPIPRPLLGNYDWSGADNEWKLAPKYPRTGGEYKFDYAKWDWVAL
jgi:hypothetical protein